MDKCLCQEEAPEQIEKEREYFREEYRRLSSEAADLQKLIIKLLFERYGFGR